MQKENLTKKQKETKGISIDTKKEIAKIGMTASLAVVVGTSFFMKNKISKRLHVGAGAALVGFSLWHHFLYQPDRKEKIETLEENINESEPQKLEVNESENITTKSMGDFVELRVEESFNSQDMESLKVLLQEIKEPKLLIRMPRISNKKLALWNKFIDTIKKSSQIQKCAIYTIGMKKYLKNRPKEWVVAGTYKKAKELLVAA